MTCTYILTLECNGNATGLGIAVFIHIHPLKTLPLCSGGETLLGGF